MSGPFVDAPVCSRHGLLYMCFQKNNNISQRGNDFVFLAMIEIMFLHFAGGAATTTFGHWFNVFCLNQIWPHFFPSESSILKARFLIWICWYCNVRFRTVIPMVWRTCVFSTAKSIIKTNGISRTLLWDMWRATKIAFSAHVSHPFWTWCFLCCNFAIQFLIKIWMCQFWYVLPTNFNNFVLVVVMSF